MRSQANRRNGGGREVGIDCSLELPWKETIPQVYGIGPGDFILFYFGPGDFNREKRPVSATQGSQNGLHPLSNKS